MTESAKLRIPYLAAAQAQKHVTVNEALTLLDTLVQLAVLDKDLTAPPGDPEEGDTFIVAASATGAWLGWDGRVARFIDGEWRSYLPGAGSGAGWRAWVIDEEALYVFDGTDWNEFAGSGGGGGRELITANRTYYVRSDGNDSNDGLTNTSGGAFATIQKAIDTAAGLDLGIFDVTISIGAGTYAPIVLKRCVGAGSIIIVGDETTPANVHLTSAASGAHIVTGTGFVTTYHLRGVKLSATGAGTRRLIHLMGAGFLFFQNIDFGAASEHMRVDAWATLEATGNYTISAGGSRHWFVQAGNLRIFSKTITLTGTPAFSTEFCLAERLGLATVQGNTFSGSATGTRYTVSTNGVIFTNGGGATYLPGNASGSAATGGQYV